VRNINKVEMSSNIRREEIQKKRGEEGVYTFYVVHKYQDDRSK
jgi:hypothetical protein